MGAQCTLNPQSPSPAVAPPLALKGRCHPGVFLPGSLPTEPLNWLLQPSTPTKSPPPPLHLLQAPAAYMASPRGIYRHLKLAPKNSSSLPKPASPPSSLQLHVDTSACLQLRVPVPTLQLDMLHAPSPAEDFLKNSKPYRSSLTPGPYSSPLTDTPTLEGATQLLLPSGDRSPFSHPSATPGDSWGPSPSASLECDQAWWWGETPQPPQPHKQTQLIWQGLPDTWKP